MKVICSDRPTVVVVDDHNPILQCEVFRIASAEETPLIIPVKYDRFVKYAGMHQMVINSGVLQDDLWLTLLVDVVDSMKVGWELGDESTVDHCITLIRQICCEVCGPEPDLYTKYVFPEEYACLAPGWYEKVKEEERAEVLRQDKLRQSSISFTYRLFYAVCDTFLDPKDIIVDILSKMPPLYTTIFTNYNWGAAILTDRTPWLLLRDPPPFEGESPILMGLMPAKIIEASIEHWLMVLHPQSYPALMYKVFKYPNKLTFEDKVKWTELMDHPVHPDVLDLMGDAEYHHPVWHIPDHDDDLRCIFRYARDVKSEVVFQLGLTTQAYKICFSVSHDCADKDLHVLQELIPSYPLDIRGVMPWFKERIRENYQYFKENGRLDIAVAFYSDPIDDISD